MKVVHVAYECVPFYKVGGLGDVAGSLPKELEKLGVNSYVVMPGYGWINKGNNLPGSTVPVLYAKSKYFAKPNITNDPQTRALIYADFALRTLELLKFKNIQPDILHCHDWHAGLVPFLIKKQADPFFSRTKTIITLHNVAFQGNYPLRFLKIPDTQSIVNYFTNNQKDISYLALGIKYADFVTTVSPHHAWEIKNGAVSFGLKQVIRAKKDNFIGILNGIDQTIWNPEADNLIYHKYALKNVDKGKEINKLKLQEDLNLVKDKNIPMFGFIARLSSQKGLDQIIALLKIAHLKRIQIVVLGKGDKKTEKLLLEYQNKVAGGWVSVNIGFDEKLAHRIYASADFFLIPSKYEPCGLTQMISMRYGTIPIVSDVGGLHDSVENGHNGWVAQKLTEDIFEKTIDKAIINWQDQEKRNKMIKNAMQTDFSWKNSSQEYLKLYNKLLK